MDGSLMNNDKITLYCDNALSFVTNVSLSYVIFPFRNIGRGGTPSLLPLWRSTYSCGSPAYENGSIRIIFGLLPKKVLKIKSDLEKCYYTALKNVE